MRGKTIFCKFGVVLLCLLLLSAEPGFTNESAREEQVKESTFNLDEASVFDIGEVSRYLIRGQSTLCNTQPVNSVKYPEFESDKPFYGSIRFSGRSAKYNTPSGYKFAIDESGGTGKGYDRFYFDHNCNLDLMDDTPLTVWENPSKGALLTYTSIEQQVCFDNFEVIFDFGSAGDRSIEIMPRLIIRNKRAEMGFVPTKICKGQVDINGEKYDAVLGSRFSIGRPFDQPGTYFCLIPVKDSQNIPNWTGSNNLKSMHNIGGTYYSFATTPIGDELFVKPYDGELGTFEVGSGGRDIEEIIIQGGLHSKENSVAVGGELVRGRPKPTKSCRLPVGDYLPAYVTITFGKLSISVSDNYHADGKPSGKDFSNRIYGIKIRKDKPYILDFSNKPDVMFASPAKNHRVKLGGQLQVAAVLIDPELDIMIRRLYDLKRGRKSLEPKVIITRAGGEKVAEGVMPFG